MLNLLSKAKRVFNRIAKEYPIDNSRPFDHRVTNLHSFEADLRIIKSVWQKKSNNFSAIFILKCRNRLKRLRHFVRSC